jgi:hypothetical protein
MDQTCSVDGCEAPVKVKKFALCGRHYARLWRHGDPTAWKKPSRPTCSVDACGLKAVGLGLCSTHYSRQKRYGTTDRPERPTSCSAPECDRPVASRGMCDMHYRRIRKGNEVEPERSCRQCGANLAGTNLQRQFCNHHCLQAWQYWERRRTHRERWLKKYDLTVEQYEAMAERQSGRCAICGGSEPKTNGGLHWCVDHDHATGKVRGLLCHDCNIGLGKFRDETSLLLRAADYLTSARST